MYYYFVLITNRTMKRLLIILLFISAQLTSSAQSPHFSQFYSNPLYLAPSFAGSTLGTRFVLNYRDQWASLPGSYISSSFSADHYFPGIKSGMGLFVLIDDAGSGKMTTMNIGYQYSYKIRATSELYIQPGLSAYYYSRRTNYSKINFADQFFGNEFLGTTSEILPEQGVNHFDFAVSAMGYTENVWFGVNVDHLMSLSPVLNSDFKYPDLRVSLFGGVKIVTKRRFRNRNNETIHLAFNFRSESKINQLDIGGYYFKAPVMVGLWYRGMPIGNTYSNSDALIYLLGVKYNRFTFSYSYDMTLGNLIANTGGSHEISINYNIDNSKRHARKKKFRAIPCPEI